MKKTLNFVFWGTPDVASGTLNILKENGYVPSFIITAPDKPQGRKMIITPPPVKAWAIENNIPYAQPEKLETKEIRDVLRTLGRSDGDGQRKFSTENFRGEQNIPDFFLVVAYGKIIPEDILNAPTLGSINVHYSLLPKYRGASPVESAILNGDTETGVTIQKMKYKMDSGPIIAEERISILPDEKAPELRTRLMKTGGGLLVKILPDFINKKTTETPQNEEEATFCKKIKKEDGLIDLSDNAEKNYNKFRAHAHWPRTFFFKNGKRIIITDATLENDSLDSPLKKHFVIKKVLPEGKKEITYGDFIRTNTLK
ncbi:MAG: methionyl-tRNA formyltransferase [Candidatus Paceibacterota bacterium]|jgi:methionyl-tRNA formyltransferase